MDYFASFDPLNTERLSSVKVAFQEIIGTELTRRVADDGWFPDEEVETVGPVDGVVVLRRIDSDRVEVTGNLRVVVTANCDRCCRTVQLPLATEFVYYCIAGQEPDGGGTETECREEDFQTLYVQDPVIDLGALFREQVYLATPARVLCRRDCQGLCQQCGTDLNDSSCSCQRPEAAGPFAVLRQLKGK